MNNLQDLFIKTLKAYLEEQKKKMIEEAVEEYRTTLEATLSHAVDNFVDNIRFSCSSQFDMGYLKHNIDMRVSVGGYFNASRYTAKGCEDKQ